MPSIPKELSITIVSLVFIAGSLGIVHSFPMYFSDRIFIIVVSWGLCVKTVSFIKDLHLALAYEKGNISFSWA